MWLSCLSWVFTLGSGKIDFPIQIATLRIGLFIICFKGSQVDFPNKCVHQSLNIAFIIANSADPDEMQTISKLYKGFIPHYQMSTIK